MAIENKKDVNSEKHTGNEEGGGGGGERKEDDGYELEKLTVKTMVVTTTML
jgi:hypothetical protein